MTINEGNESKTERLKEWLEVGRFVLTVVLLVAATLFDDKKK